MRKLHPRERRKWYEHEIEFLKNNFDKLSIEELGARLHRKKGALISKISSLRLYEQKYGYGKEKNGLKKKRNI